MYYTIKRINREGLSVLAVQLGNDQDKTYEVGELLDGDVPDGTTRGKADEFMGDAWVTIRDRKIMQIVPCWRHVSSAEAEARTFRSAVAGVTTKPWWPIDPLDVEDDLLAAVLVQRLNALCQDKEVREVFEVLMESRVPVTDHIKKHPTIQSIDGQVGFLGLLNGIVGVIPNGPKRDWGYLAAYWGEEDRFLGFALTDTPQIKAAQQSEEDVVIDLKPLELREV